MSARRGGSRRGGILLAGWMQVVLGLTAFFLGIAANELIGIIGGLLIYAVGAGLLLYMRGRD